MSDGPKPVLDFEASLLVRPCGRLIILAEMPGISAWINGPARASRIYCGHAHSDPGQDPVERWQLLAGDRDCPPGHETPIAQSTGLYTPSEPILDLLSAQCVVDCVATDASTATLVHMLLCVEQTERARQGLYDLYDRELLAIEERAHRTLTPSRHERTDGERQR